MLVLLHHIVKHADMYMYPVFNNICVICWIFVCLSQRKTPDDEAKYWMECGLDQEGFSLKYISDYKGKQI